MFGFHVSTWTWVEYLHENLEYELFIVNLEVLTMIAAVLWKAFNFIELMAVLMRSYWFLFWIHLFLWRNRRKSKLNQMKIDAWNTCENQYMFRLIGRHFHLLRRHRRWAILLASFEIHFSWMFPIAPIHAHLATYPGAHIYKHGVSVWPEYF